MQLGALTALTALAEDLDLVLMTQRTAHSQDYSSREPNTHFWPLRGTVNT